METQTAVIPSVDSKGREFYTPEQVKQMADERGLPARLVTIDASKRYPYQVIKPESTVEALGVVRDWRRYYPHEYPKATQGTQRPPQDPYEYAGYLASMNMD